MGKSRNAILRETIEAEVMPALGQADADDVLDYMLERGDITEAELASTFGRAGFKRTVIDPVFKAAGPDGNDKFPPMPNGKHAQIDLFSADDCCWLYQQRKAHRDDCTAKLEKLRVYIIDRFGVDPE